MNTTTAVRRPRSPEEAELEAIRITQSVVDMFERDRCQNCGCVPDMVVPGCKCKPGIRLPKKIMSKVEFRKSHHLVLDDAATDHAKHRFPEDGQTYDQAYQWAYVTDLDYEYDNYVEGFSRFYKPIRKALL